MKNYLLAHFAISGTPNFPISTQICENKSTTLNLVVISQFISEELVNRGQIDVIYIYIVYTDMSKAFDILDY